MRGLPGHADADGHVGLGGGQGGGFHGGAQALAQAQGVADVGRGQGGDELLAAVAGQQVITALQAAVEDRGDRLQAAITFRMPVGVVESLEVVDIDHQHRQPHALATGAAVRAAERFIEVAPVAEPGQRIAPGQQRQLVALTLDLHLGEHAAQGMAEHGTDEPHGGQGRLQACHQQRHHHQQQRQHQRHAGIDDAAEVARHSHRRWAVRAAGQHCQQHEQPADQQVAPATIGYLRLPGIDVERHQEVAERVDRQRAEEVAAVGIVLGQEADQREAEHQAVLHVAQGVQALRPQCGVEVCHRPRMHEVQQPQQRDDRQVHRTDTAVAAAWAGGNVGQRNPVEHIQDQRRGGHLRRAEAGHIAIQQGQQGQREQADGSAQRSPLAGRLAVARASHAGQSGQKGGGDQHQVGANRVLRADQGNDERVRDHEKQCRTQRHAFPRPQIRLGSR